MHACKIQRQNKSLTNANLLAFNPIDVQKEGASLQILHEQLHMKFTQGTPSEMRDSIGEDK